jgi:two-component system NtrC family response regulator/two-component system response regulator AtoC
MSEKILLVDDDEDLVEILVERMKMRGLTVTSARTATEAINLIEKEPFDVMIIDLMLPGIDGLQAIKTIREKCPDLRIIMQTAYATTEKKKEALEMGAWGVVEKPMDLDRLTKLIGNKGEPPHP